MKTFETENLKIQYTRGNQLDSGEYPKKTFTVDVIEKMTFKKPVIYMKDDRLTINRSLIQDARRDFWEEVKKELRPHGIPCGSHGCVDVPIVEMNFAVIQDGFYDNELRDAKKIISVLMGLMDGKLMPDNTDTVYEMMYDSTFYEPELNYYEINREGVKVQLIVSLDKFISEYEIEYARTHRQGF